MSRSIAQYRAVQLETTPAVAKNQGLGTPNPSVVPLGSELSNEEAGACRMGLRRVWTCHTPEEAYPRTSGSVRGARPIAPVSLIAAEFYTLARAADRDRGGGGTPAAFNNPGTQCSNRACAPRTALFDRQRALALLVLVVSDPAGRASGPRME